MPFLTVSVRRDRRQTSKVHAEASAVWYDSAGHRERQLAAVDLEVPPGSPEAVLARALQALATALGVPADGGGSD